MAVVTHDEFGAAVERLSHTLVVRGFTPSERILDEDDEVGWAVEIKGVKFEVIIRVPLDDEIERD